MTNTATHRPTSSTGQHSARHAPTQGADAGLGGHAKGTWVEVASGPAQGVRGRIIERIGNNVTIQALLLGQRPLLLTVASTACAPLEAPAEHW